MNKKTTCCFKDPTLKQLQQELIDLCKDGDLELIKILFESTDRVRYEKELLETRDNDKKTILHLVSSSTI
jgi:hypothetical protein